MSCFSQLLCPPSCWTKCVCPRGRWGCPVALREGTDLNTVGLWMDGHYRTLSSSLEIIKLTTSLWNNTFQDNWSAKSGIISVMPWKSRRYLLVVRQNIIRIVMTTMFILSISHNWSVCLPIGFVFINCSSLNGTHMWVSEVNNTLCVTDGVTSDTKTITNGKNSGEIGSS